MTSSRGNARYIAAVLAVIGGVSVAAQVSHYVGVDGQARTYSDHLLGPVLAGFLLARHGAVRARHAAFAAGTFAMTLVAIVTFAVSGALGGVIAASDMPLLVLAVLVAEGGLGAAAGVHLGRRGDPERVNVIATVGLATVVGAGANVLALQLYLGLAESPFHSLWEWAAVQLAATLVAGFFAQATAMVQRRTACAIGFGVLPAADFVYVVIAGHGPLVVQWEIGVLFAALLAVGWIGAHVGWHVVARHLSADPEAIVAVFE